jgi:O-antigen ligase
MSTTLIQTVPPTENAAIRTIGTEAEHVGAGWAFFFLLLFTGFLYLRPEDMVFALGFWHLEQAIAICAGASFVVALALGLAKICLTRELKIVFAITLCYAASIPFAFWGTGAYNVFTQIWLKTVFVFFLLSQTLLTLARIRKLIWVVLLCELFAAAVSIIQQAGMAVEKGERLTGYNQGFLGWNFLGTAAAISLPYIVALLLSKPSFLRITLLGSTFLALMWMLVLTASRGGFLTVVFSLVLTFFFLLRGNRRGRILTALILIAFGINLSRAPEIFWTRLGTIFSTTDSRYVTDEAAASARLSSEGRGGLLADSIEYTLERPLFGWGLGNFAVVRGNRMKTASAWYGTHNTFTQISSEAGIPALVLFLFLSGVLLKNLSRDARIFRDDPNTLELRLLTKATTVSVCSFLFGGFFAHLGYDYYFYYIAGISGGLHILAQKTQISLSLPSRQTESPSPIISPWKNQNPGESL